MKFDADHGDRGLVYDADGNLLPYPIRGDTVTGKVVCRVVDSNGLPIIDEKTGDIRTLTAMFKAPLQIRPLHEGA